MLLCNMRLLHAIVLAFSSSVLGYKNYSGYKVFSIEHSRVNQKYVKFLEEKFSADVWDARNGKTDIMVAPDKIDSFIEMLNMHGLHQNFAVKIEDVGSLIKKPTQSKLVENLADFDYEVYHSYEEIQDWMDMIEQEYSEYV